VPADTSGLQAGKNLYAFGPTRFVIAQKMLLLCILHFVRQHDKSQFTHFAKHINIGYCVPFRNLLKSK
jgi:hypothetical protein